MNITPQLSCGDTCQIWMWFNEWNSRFCTIENFAHEVNEMSFGNPTLGPSCREPSGTNNHYWGVNTHDIVSAINDIAYSSSWYYWFQQTGFNFQTQIIFIGMIISVPSYLYMIRLYLTWCNLPKRYDHCWFRRIEQIYSELSRCYYRSFSILWAILLVIIRHWY